MLLIDRQLLIKTQELSEALVALAAEIMDESATLQALLAHLEAQGGNDVPT